MASKLKNVSAIQKMLNGEHRTQTRTKISTNNLSVKESNILARKYKNIGDTWYEYDSDGKVENVVTKLGLSTYRIRSEMIYQRELDGDDDSQYTFKNCPKETCTCVEPTRLDEKFRVLRGMCFDCNIAKETEMKINGTFNDYAKNILLNNAKSYFNERDNELKDVKKSLLGGVGYVHGDGSVEKWEEGGQNMESVIAKIDEEYEMIKKNTIDNINKI